MALNRQLFVLLTCGILSLFTVTCESDVDVINIDANHRTIVYGLLDAGESQHFIRINKSFQGTVSAAELAATPGINEYSDSDLLSATVYQLENETDDISQSINSYELLDSTITTKADGAFSNESNKVYYFNATLNAAHFYKFVCEVRKEDGSIEEVSAVTPIVQNERVLLQRPRNSDNVCDANNLRDNDEARFVQNVDYVESYEVQWTAAQNGILYTSRFWFYYSEVLFDGTVRRDSVMIPLGTREVSAESVVGQIEFTFRTAEFYSLIGNQVPDFDADEICYRRASDTLQFELEIAGEELAIYRDVNSPQTGVIQERPTYTNIVNGEGIFSSRIRLSTRADCDQEDGILMDNKAMDELVNSNLQNTGNFTVSKSFCSNIAGLSQGSICTVDRCP